MEFVISRRPSAASMTTLQDMIMDIEEGIYDPEDVGELFFFSAPSWEHADRIFSEETRE